MRPRSNVGGLVLLFFLIQNSRAFLQVPPRPQASVVAAAARRARDPQIRPRHHLRPIRRRLFRRSKPIVAPVLLDIRGGQEEGCPRSATLLSASSAAAAAVALPEFAMGPLRAAAIALMRWAAPAVALGAGALESGPFGAVALMACSALVLLPATQIRNVWGISVGYGGSVCAIACLLRSFFGGTFHPRSVGDVLTRAAIFYGLRLATYLLVRDLTGWRPSSSNRQQPPRLKRIPFACSLAVFYGFLTTPLLYVLRNPPLTVAGSRIAWTGAAAAWAGAVLEAVADAHKFLVKVAYRRNRRIGAAADAPSRFRGPDSGAYLLTRHPNYTGEVLFWTGVFVAGVPSFGRSAVGWSCSSAGLYGILNIMRKASEGLERRHASKYGGQIRYEEWKENVPWPLIPFVQE